jgi:hypothetical protein
LTLSAAFNQSEETMKPILLMLASIAMLALEGCAIMNATGTSAYEVDSAKVAAVESAARQAGVQVYWLNYPRKKVEQ